MYVEDLRKDFYNIVIGERLLLLVNYDVDAICACKILLHLLHFENTLYTLVPVNSVKDLQDAVEANPNVKYIIFINCGGTFDIVDALEPNEDVVFFIIDSHKPTDVCNVYSNNQVRLLMQPDDDDRIPSFEDIFREDELDSDSEHESDDGDETELNKRRRLDEEALLKRREHRLWLEKRNKIMFEYTQYSFYGKSSAVTMFELAWKLSKDNNDLLWWAIIGLTEQILLAKIENQNYVLESGNLQSHVSRLSHQVSLEEEDKSTAMKITYDRDLKLALYRHWTVEASLRNSMYSACKLKLWTLKGERRLYELLAEMGLPLVQSRQKFRSMDLTLRQEFKSMIEKNAERYCMENIVYASFVLQYGYGNCFCALDVVYAMLAMLDSPMKNGGCDHFMNAMDCLSRAKKDALEEGINKAKHILICIFKQVQNLLDMKQIISAGPFLYFVLQEGAVTSKPFASPHFLTLLAQFALHAYVATSRNRKAPNLPIIGCAPLDTENRTCLIVGIPPVSEDSPKNFFGKAFEQAAEDTHARVGMDYFDSSIIQLNVEDRVKFFDALTTLLG